MICFKGNSKDTSIGGGAAENLSLLQSWPAESREGPSWSLLPVHRQDQRVACTLRLEQCKRGFWGVGPFLAHYNMDGNCYGMHGLFVGCVAMGTC